MFKINATDWNNVPKIVYDAFCTIITQYDANYLQQKQKHEAIQRDFQAQRAADDDLERKMEDANDKLKGNLEAAAKKDRDKVRSLNEDMLGRHSRVMSLISDLQRNVTASINKLEGH